MRSLDTCGSCTRSSIGQARRGENENAAPLNTLSAPPCRVSEVDDENAEDRLMDNVITCGDEAYIIFTYQTGPSTPLKST
jgi:hypothetical protein